MLIGWNIMQYNSVIKDVFVLADDFISDMTQVIYPQLVDNLAIPLASLLSLYFVLMGMAILQGKISLSFESLVHQFLKISFVLLFALNWGTVCQYLLDLFVNISSELATICFQMIVQYSDGVPQNLDEMHTLPSILQLTVTHVTKLFNNIWAQGSLTSPSPWLTSLLFVLFSFGVLLLTVFELITAKLILAVLLLLTPLMVCSTLFKATYGFFDSWLGHLSAYAMVSLLVATTSMIAVTFLMAALSPYVIDITRVRLVSFVPVMVAGVIGLGLVMKATKIGISIGCSLSSLSQSGQWGQQVGSFLTLVQ